MIRDLNTPSIITIYEQRKSIIAVEWRTSTNSTLVSKLRPLVGGREDRQHIGVLVMTRKRNTLIFYVGLCFMHTRSISSTCPQISHSFLDKDFFFNSSIIITNVSTQSIQNKLRKTVVTFPLYMSECKSI